MSFSSKPSSSPSSDLLSADYKGSKDVTADQHIEYVNPTPSGLPAELAPGMDDALVVAEGEDKMSPFTYLLCSAAGLSGFLFGYDTGVISAALVNIGTDINGRLLSNVEKEWTTASTSVGALIGAVIGGGLVDRIGRKWVLAVGDVFFVLGALIIAASYHLPQIIIGRLILGFGVGIASAITPMYIGELAPARFRSRLVTIQSMMITGGQVVAYAIGAGLTMHNGWRALFAISILPAVVQAALVHWLPESPRFLLLKDRVDEARKCLSLVYSSATPEQIDLKIQVIQINVRAVQAFNIQHTTWQKLKLIATRGAYRRPTLVAMGMQFFQQFSGFNTLLYYSATLFATAGFNNPTATGLIIAATNFAFTFFACLTLDKFGKRRVTLICYPFMIIGLAVAAVAFSQMVKSSGGVLTDTVAYPQKWTALMICMIVLFAATYATSIGSIAWHQAELFPLEIRGFSASIATVTNWGANLIVSSTFLTMLENVGAPGTFGYYSGWCAVAFVFLYFCYPETKLLTLEESSSLFVDDFGIERSRRLRAHKLAVRRGAKDEVSDVGGEKDSI